MKNIVLTPNPYRDKNFQTVRSALQILKNAVRWAAPAAPRRTLACSHEEVAPERKQKAEPE